MATWQTEDTSQSVYEKSFTDLRKLQILSFDRPSIYICRLLITMFRISYIMWMLTATYLYAYFTYIDIPFSIRFHLNSIKHNFFSKKIANVMIFQYR